MKEQNGSTDNIDELLKEFRAQRNEKEKQQINPLEPPKRREELIDFSKEAEPEIKAEDKKETKKRAEKTPEQLAELKQQRKDKLSEFFKHLFSKKVVLPVLAVVLIIAVGFGAKYYAEYSKTAYLKPYTQKYPDVNFPVGILKEYCDAYGENPDVYAHISIDDIELDKMLMADECEVPVKGASTDNFVVYLDDNSLEEHYKNASAYNNSTKQIGYCDLFNEYTFQVAGAFYTNTKPEDDDGYIFPYNTCELMSFDSTNAFLERLNTRIIYKVKGLDLARSDTLLTISCPTDYKEDYRFVVICKAVDKINPDALATDNDKIHITDSEYKEQGIENPYRFASKWYPEIIITDEIGNISTIKRTIDDYKN